MRPADFIATARDLVSNTRGRPRETNLRRAVSTTYYALFHAIAACCADTLVGGPNSNRSAEAWTQVYRSLNHRPAKARCDQLPAERFPDEIEEFASRFVDMQFKRHEADYNPDAQFNKDAVVQDIDDAEYQLEQFVKVPLANRRTFAVHVLMNPRRS